jgi:hypothetical protein
VRTTLESALVSCVDRIHQPKVRRFVQGLSADELQFIAGFLGACVLDSGSNSHASRAQWATQIERYQQESSGYHTCRSSDQEHKMILLLEFLSRTAPRPQGAVFSNQA